MYNTRFTPDQFGGEIQFGKKYRAVTTPQGEYLCGVSSKNVCDLNGNVLAEFSHEQEMESDGKEFTVRVYRSVQYGDFTVKDNTLWLGEELLGSMPAKKKRAPLILLGATCLLLALTIALIALIDLPYAETPVIDVKDDNGSWSAQGTIAVFDDKIMPGSDGEYEFIIRNPHDIRLSYSFTIGERYNGEPVENFPLEYRVRVNNALIGSEQWLSAEELHFGDLLLMAQSDYLVALEWRWPFEGENNAVDTQFGADGGEYSLEFELTAEAISEIRG